MIKNIILGFITCCLLLTAFSISPIDISAQSKKDVRNAKKLKDEGDKIFLQKDYKAAIDKYAQAITLTPNYSEAHFWKGYAHYYLKEYDEALTEINTASDQGFKQTLELYKVRWYLNYQKKNYDAAYDDVQKGLQLEPTNIAFITASGDVSLAKNDYENALAAYAKAVQINPNSGDLYYFLALSHSNLKNYPEQGTAAMEAIKKGTKYIGESYLLAGEALRKERRYAEAIEAYQRALTAKEDNPAVYRTMAELYRHLSRFNDAITTARKGLKFSPNDGNIYTELSWYYSLADRNPEAVQAAQAAIRFSPDQSVGYTNLCRAYNETNQYQMAINNCNKALQISPNDGETYFYLGRAYDLIGKPSEAPKYYSKAVGGLVEFTQSNTEDSDGFYILGNAYYADNQQDKAIEAYKKSLELSPGFTKARYNLGAIYSIKGNKDAAREQHKELLTLDPALAEKLKQIIDKK